MKAVEAGGVGFRAVFLCLLRHGARGASRSTGIGTGAVGGELEAQAGAQATSRFDGQRSAKKSLPVKRGIFQRLASYLQRLQWGQKSSMLFLFTDRNSKNKNKTNRLLSSIT